MLRKVKNWLGIEGVKLELEVPKEIDADKGSLRGKIRFYSMHEQTVSTIRIKLMERYTRGRGNDKTTDEYELGAIQLRRPILVPAKEVVELDFELPFAPMKSEVDEIADRNILLSGLAGAARWLNAVQSIFRVEAEASVKGTALHPFDRQEINLK